MNPPLPLLLEDRWVRLEPLAASHRSELAALAEDPMRWEFSPVDDRGGPFATWADKWFDAAAREHGAGTQVVFVVRDAASGLVVGSTRYLNIETPHRRLEIGSTFYAPAARGTYVNRACKRLLFAYAFETLGANRVELKCDARNARSRAAIAGLGATQEGILRRHMILGDGFVRDTVYFSVLDREWSAVRATLEARLDGCLGPGATSP